MRQIAIGIDIGGTNTYVGIIEENGKIISKTHLNTNGHGDISSFVEKIKSQIDGSLSKIENFNLVGIGIGAPNGNFYTGNIEHAPNIPWKGLVPLRDVFNSFFPNVPVYVTNDANAAALGEKIYGRAKELDDFVVVTLGTGLGSGFVVNGKMLYGHDGFAGELGHTIIKEGGRQCGCGRKGCLETYASATGFLKTARKYIKGSHDQSLLHRIPAASLNALDVTIAAEEEDELAKEIFEYTGKKLGFGLANMVNITSPKEIILFGGLANAGDMLIEPTKRYMEKYLLNIFKGKVTISTSSLNNNHAAILGAGALVWQEKQKQLV